LDKRTLGIILEWSLGRVIGVHPAKERAQQALRAQRGAMINKNLLL